MIVLIGCFTRSARMSFECGKVSSNQHWILDFLSFILGEYVRCH
jgi:hypothetical protein